MFPLFSFFFFFCACTCVFTWLPLRPSQGSCPCVNISHRVTPNIHVSVAWENVLVLRLSGAHLQPDKQTTSAWTERERWPGQKYICNASSQTLKNLYNLQTSCSIDLKSGKISLTVIKPSKPCFIRIFSMGGMQP